MRVLMAANDGVRACRIGRNLPSLDFVGLSAVFGSNATKAGIPYTCLFRSRVPYLNLYVPAGTLGLAQAVLACIDWRPARILIGKGEAGSILELCGVKASENASYVGLQSGTAQPVRGVVGEALVSELVRQGKESKCEVIGRSSARPTYVIWAKIPESYNSVDDRDVRVSGDEGALINFFTTSVCVVVLVLEAMCHEWFSFAVVATGMILNATMAFLLRLQKFEVAIASPAEGVPPGDSVISLKDDPNVFCVLRGSEKAIQELLQKEVVLNARWVKHLPLLNAESVKHLEWVKHLPLFLVSVALLIYSAVVVLGVPHLRPSAQLMFLIVVGVGAMTDLVKGSWNGKRGVAEEALKKYRIETIGVKKFGNRTAAVACVAAGSTKLDALKSAGICTTAGSAWQNWWNALEILNEANVQEEDGKSKLQEETFATRSAFVQENEKVLWGTLTADMRVGLEHAIED